MNAGKHPRFERLYWAHHRDLLAFIRRRVQLDVAEDVLAETYVVAWRKIDEIPDSERAWLFGVARNVIRSEFRSQARQRDLAVKAAQDVDDQTAPFDDAIASRTDLVRAWGQLSETEQEVLALIAWDGLSNDEGAQVVGVTTSAFAVRLFRARRRLLHLIERGQTGRGPEGAR